MEKFLVIDGNSIMNRAFYGVMNKKMLSTKDGLYTNAIYGFLNIYWMMLEKEKFDYVAVSFDLKAPTFRHEMYKEYKANRKAMPEELKIQMPVIKEVLKAMNISILEIEGYEADDVLGTISKSNESKEIATYILTGDRDSFQLISQLTTVVMPISKMGKTEYLLYTPELLKEKYTITPSQVIEVKALMGDSSDNIPGVKGIGEKTAHILVNSYNDIDTIYSNINTIDVSDKIKEKLKNDKEMAYTSRTLATINRDVPININYEECRIKEINKEEVYKLFKNLEFNKFLAKFDFSDVENSLNISVNETKKLNIPNLTTHSTCYNITNLSDTNFQKFENILNNEEKISYYLNIYDNRNEKSQNITNKKISYISIYSEANNIIYTVYLDKLDSNDRLKLLDIFAKSKVNKLGYNIKQDILYMFNNNISTISNFNFDLLIAYYLIDSNKTKYEFSKIYEELFDISFNANISSITNTQISLFDTLDTSSTKQDDVLSEDENFNLTLYLKGIYYSYDIILQKLKSLNMYMLYHDVEMPLVETLANMEYNGMYIDLNKLNEFDIDLTKNILDIQKEIYTLAGEEFNISSTQQLGKIIFEKLGLPTKRKTKTGYSTDKEVLEELSEYHEIIPKVLDYRQFVKLKTTYVDGLRNKIADDGRIHTTFMQTVASTGRLSSTEPNLQNIPVRLELGRKIRSFFTSESYSLIVDADYSQIELRVLASLANDETMIKAFKNNEDIHTVTASQVFGVDINNVTKEMRSKAKAVNFGIVYGISDFGLAKNIGTSVKDANKYINNYLDKYIGIKEYMESTVAKAKEDGYVTTILGRIRYIPELKASNKNVLQFGERIAMNTPIQGSAADIIKLAMNKVYNEIKEKKLKSKLVMQVHDELIIESKKDEVNIIKEILKNCMENVIELSVPLNIDLNVGKSWYDTK